MKHKHGLTGYNHLTCQFGRSLRAFQDPFQSRQVRCIHKTRANPISQTIPLQSTLDGRENHSSQTFHSDRFANALPFSAFLTDKHARQHTYLRISLTERCNLRCTYCMPEAGVPLSPQSTQLTTPEILLLSSLFVSQGVNKIRLTGGEPTVRKDIVPLMQQLGELRANGLKELCITSNGVALKNKLESMHKAGLTGVNLSLDTLDPNLFMIMARRPGFSKVIEAMERILAMNKMGAGITLKVNVVVMKGINESEILRFVELGKDKDLEVRFIEYMPFDGNRWAKNKMVSYQDMLHIIRQKYPELEKVTDKKGDTSKSYRVPGFAGRVGFITSMTENFCATCNRLRITSDGNLKVCLFGNSEVSLRDLIRKGNDNQPIDEEALAAIKAAGQLNSNSVWQESEHELLHAIGLAVGRKEAQHDSMDVLKETKNRPMILIGGANPYLLDNYTRTIPDRHLLRPRTLGHEFRPILATPPFWISPQLSFRQLFSTTARRESTDGNSRPPEKDPDELSATDSNKEETLLASEDDQEFVADADMASTTIEDESTQQSDGVENTLDLANQLASQIEEEMDLLLDEVESLVNQQKITAAFTKSQSSTHDPTERHGTRPSVTDKTFLEDTDNSHSDAVPSRLRVLRNHHRDQLRSSKPPSARLAHLNANSAVHMVSIANKAITKRKAIAIGTISLPHSAIRAILAHKVEKGDVLGVARIAAIQGVKKTSDMIPLCHPGLAIDGIKVDISIIASDKARPGQADNEKNDLPFWLSYWLNASSRRQPICIKMAVTVESTGRTGIEMEALTGVNAGLLTIYDMCKSISKEMVITSQVAFKSGGSSGTWKSSLSANLRVPVQDSSRLDDDEFEHLTYKSIPLETFGGDTQDEAAE